MTTRPGGARRRAKATVVLVAMSLIGSACGSRLGGGAMALAEGAGHNGSASGASASVSGNSTGSSSTADTAVNSTAGSAGAGGSGASSTAGPSTAANAAAGSTGATSAGANNSTSCTSADNGGATDTGVTANQILIGNITSITGVAPGLTQSAQQATEAFAQYVNSQGGICGRLLKVQAFDDGNTSSGNYSDAAQACSSDFAMVGNASGFDDGGASAVSSCGIPDVAAEVSTHAAGNVADIYGASPGNAHYWSTGPAVWLKKTDPTAVTHAAMIYLNVPATQEQAQAEMSTYTSVGFNYIYSAAVSPTEPNYAPYVQNMESKGVQYVTEYSDDNSAARLAQAMQQASFAPQVVDWFSEMYSPAFLQEAQGTANGNLVLMATAPYEEAASNPGMALFLSWMNRVAPGFTHDIFAEFAWSAGMYFLQAAKVVGAHLTRAALLAQLAQIHQLPANDTVQYAEDFGRHIPSNCFAYFKINGSGNGYSRVYPAGPNSLDCTSGTVAHY
ncbi:MAG TPA: ABC transporter substrate-binding protein [Acidimicrobiales bacterium]|nr:ABC transporter substrate-binding protein [Acidimicrobiales bacterium]